MKKILLLILVILCLSLTSCSFIYVTNGEDNGSQSTGDQTKNQSQQTNGNLQYSIGDTAKIKATFGNYNLKITNVRQGKINESAEKQPKKVILVEYEYQNIDCNQDITISYAYFRAYDKSGNLLDVYPSIEMEGPNTIAAGGKKTASIAYGLNDDTNFIKLDFYNIDYSDMLNATCTFNLEW